MCEAVGKTPGELRRDTTREEFGVFWRMVAEKARREQREADRAKRRV